MSGRQFSKPKPVVVRNDDRLTLCFDELRVQSEMRLDAPDELVLGYTRTMMGFLLFNPQPTHIAMIGLGGGSLTKYCYAALPDCRIMVAEIDPDVIALRERFFIPRDDTRLRISCADGAAFVHDAANQYDVLIVDGFTEDGQPPSLSTQRFYNDCQNSLTDKGVLVANLHDLNAGTEPLIARMRHAFNHAVIVIDAEGSTNRIVFAGKGGVLDVSDDELMDRLTQLEMHLPLNLYRTVREMRMVREG
jgi:spermidine synthase